MKINRNKISLRSLSTFYIFLLLINVQQFLLSIQSVQAADPLTFKWSTNVASTTQAAVAEDLNGDTVYDVVATGVGKCVALDGKTGAVMWTYTNSQIGNHHPAEISDLDNDGNYEVIISAQYPVVLHGNNGTLWWTTSSTLAYQNYHANFDIDGDDYKEIFTTSGTAFNTSYDYISRLSYNGNIIAQASVWHSCYGGLTIADTNFDGRFELYVGDRRVTLSGQTDLYKGGAMGLKALDALTLKPLWNDPTILCSSQAPQIADVDNNGILDIIVADQSSDGIAVYNSADGSVVTTGGIYRKGSTNMPAHSNPTICDLDGDGNLEYISVRKLSAVKIWDLYTWKEDGTLMQDSTTVLKTQEPPKVGDVNGDGKMDIIAVAPTGIYIYTNSGPKVYDLMYYFNNTGTDNPLKGDPTMNNFTCLQDVDGDGLNELILTSSWGKVYCFDTLSTAPNPKVRSEVQFYSEFRNSVAEYVAPPIPSTPVLIDEQPMDKSLNQASNPVLSIRATSFQKLNMNIQFSTGASESGPWVNLGGQFTGVPSGVYSRTPSNMNSPGTKYYWRVSATDSAGKETVKVFSFTTSSTAPTQGNPLLQAANGDLNAYNQNTVDANGDEVTNVFNWKVNGGSVTGLNLPFETRTTNNLLSTDLLFSDSFDIGFSKWTTDWDINTAQYHSGPSSAHAGGSSNDLISNSINTAATQGIIVSFWYRDHGLHSSDGYLQFWDGTSYTPAILTGGKIVSGYPKNVIRSYIFRLGNSVPEDTWQFYSIELNEPRYLIPDFRVKFEASSLVAGEDLWIDDLSVTTFTQTKDYSGSNNDATVNGATWTPDGIVGGAYVFDGNNDYMRIGDDPSLGGDGTWSEISLEYWIKPTENRNKAYIISKKDPSNSSLTRESVGCYMVGFRDTGPANTLFWGVCNGAVDSRGWLIRTDLWNEKTTVLPINKWSHVVVTYESGPGLSIYINGTLRANMPLTGNIAIAPGTSVQKAPLYIGYDGGADIDWPGEYFGGSTRYRWFSGILDEVRIYNRALSATQITQRYTDTNTGSSSRSTMKASEMITGQTWTIEVTPNDSYGDGATKSASAPTPTGQTQTYTLTIQTPDGSGTTNPATGTQTYNAGTSVPVSATPAAEWMFDHWVLDGVDAGSANPLTVTMNAAHTLKAVYTPIQYTLTVSPVGQGSVAKNPNQASYASGSLVQLTATPASGWVFSGWSGDASGSSNPVTVSMTANKAVTATFTQSVPILSDSTFDGSVDSAALRANGVGPDWYECAAGFYKGDASLLTLNTENIGGDSGKKAALKNYSVSSNAYLTQDFAPQTGTFTLSFRIYVDRIANNGYYDRTGHIYVGNDASTSSCPTGTANERFVYLAFLDRTPGTSGTDIQLKARTSSSQSISSTSSWTTVTTGLSYDHWYTIKLVVNVGTGKYDVYVDGVFKMSVNKYSGYSGSSVSYVSFAADSSGRGDFYVDDVYSPAP